MILIKKTSFILVLLLAAILNSCAEKQIYLKSIPAPPQTNKIRVALIIIYEPFYTNIYGTGLSYKVSYEDLIKIQSINLSRFLIQQGFYEVVPEEDLRAVLGNQRPTWKQLEVNNWDLAKQIAAKLYANYVLMFERGVEARFFFCKINMINATTGALYSVQEDVKGGFIQNEANEIIKKAYRNLFTKANRDMLATALEKAGEKTIHSESSTTPKILEPFIKKDPMTINEKTEQDQKKKENETEKGRVLEPLIQTKKIPDSRSTLIVYDFDADANMKVVALILTDALREELHKIGSFELLNREDLNKISQEWRFQTSGFVDEKESVKIGNLIGARESITGRLVSLGNTYILSAKRIDIQTLKTKNISSIKCPKGNEEELLKSIPILAKKLLEIQ